MAGLFCDSFDSYQTAQITRKWTTKYQAPLIVTPGRCGGQAIKFPTISNVYKGVTPVGATPSGTAGFACYIETTLNGTTLFAVGRTGIGGNDQFTVRYDPHSGALVVYNGNSELQAQTSTDAVREGEWFFLEVQWTIHNTTGAIKIHVNEVEVLSATGLDLEYSSSPDHTWDSVGLVGSANTIWYADDFYVLDDSGAAPCNTFLGDCRVQAVYPISAGANSDWAPHGAAENWDCVDDDDASHVIGLPDDNATYVEGSNVGEKDTHVYSEADLASGTIFWVQTAIMAEKMDTGVRSIAAVMRQAGLDSVGANRNPSYLSYNDQIEVFQTNPRTGVAFVVADVRGASRAEWGYQITV